MNFHRCMLRGFRLHRCPYWIRPSITVSDHSGNTNLLFLCSQFIASHLCSHWNFLEQLCYCLCLPLLLILVYSRLSPILNELIYVPFFYVCVCDRGPLLNKKASANQGSSGIFESPLDKIYVWHDWFFSTAWPVFSKECFSSGTAYFVSSFSAWILLHELAYGHWI